MSPDKNQVELISEPHESKTFIQAPDFKSIYVNNIHFGFTRFDFQMVLGLVQVTKDESKSDVVIETTSVKMTPAYAKALATDLMVAIGGYEAQYGEIPMPPLMVPPKGAGSALASATRPKKPR